MYLATETLAGVSVASLFFRVSDRRVGRNVGKWFIDRQAAAGTEGAGREMGLAGRNLTAEAFETRWRGEKSGKNNNALSFLPKRAGECDEGGWNEGRKARLGQTKRHDFEGHAFFAILFSALLIQRCPRT